MNSDAGVIVTFGGPFNLLGNNGGGNGYGPGNTIFLGIEYLTAGDGVSGVPNTREFFIHHGVVVVTTGAWPGHLGGPGRGIAGPADPTPTV